MAARAAKSGQRGRGIRLRLGIAGRWLRSVRPGPGTLRRDAIAGVPGAVGSVPDGMASAVLVGVNPVYGLYASFAGPVAGGLTASTRLMVITTTTAAALAAGSAVEGFNADKRPEALFMLTVLAGAVMVAAGLLRLGRYTRFVSFSVMIGFLTGVAANIIFGQIPDLTGASATGDVAIEKALEVVLHPSRIEPASLLTGAAALALLIGLARTRLAAFSAVIALVVPTLLTLSVDSIARVEDAGEIPTGFPLPHIPDLALGVDPNVLVGALSVAVIVLVQGVGGSAKRQPTPTAARRTRIATSSPRARATSPPAFSAGNRWGARSARRRSTSPRGRAGAGRRSSPAYGCSQSSSPSRASSARW
jgi:SulP family sulfate permease